MKRFQLSTFLTFFVLVVYFVPGNSQNDLLKGIFDKELPQFTASLKSTENEGEAELIYYFTHSKANSIEASIWIKDLGTTLLENGEKRLLKGLQEVGNRQEIYALLNGLNTLHFYTVGIDYRLTNGINRKFNTIILKEGFRYEGPVKAEKIEQKEEVVQKGKRKENVVEEEPCVMPSIRMRLDSKGYCESLQRPAVLLQCENCQGKDWTFSVETRGEYGDWRPLRTDGMRQKASGAALRTEPLCILQPGVYYLRVLAWGAFCDKPVIENLPNTILISDQEKEEQLVSYNDEQAEEIEATLPENCLIEGSAQLIGNKIKGTLNLNANSPCHGLNPFVKLRYVHPGYRDITLDDMPLIAGSTLPFEFYLDETDLNRGIQTIQVIEFVNPNQLKSEVQLRSFWIKADVSNSKQADFALQQGTTSFENDTKSTSGLEEKGEWTSSIDEEMDIETINVSASDPNCNQIQDLQLVYGAGKADLPLFISWLSPRCCQEDGCNYTIWAGETPEKLRLLIKGNKPGAEVRELLQSIDLDDQYFEVVVKTGNGARKAAYVVGEGPKYGFEEILAYHDRDNPVQSDPIVYEKIGFDTYSKPELPISEFRSCRIFRETSVSSNNPLKTGDKVEIEYHFSEKGYQYTLYQLPEGSEEWFITPGTSELSKSAVFSFTAGPQHNGKYLILAYNPELNWGCLSKPISEAIEITVEETDK